MKNRKSVFICVMVLVLGGIYLNPVVANDSYGRTEIQQDQQKADKFVERYHVTEALGPLAPVAMSPFFGLACLSGASILCDWGWLPPNDFLQGNEVLNNWLVFLLFSGLTVVTSVPKLVSVSKIFAEAADRLETYASIISYGVILLAAQQAAPQQEVVVFSAGVISVTNNGLLAIAAAANIFVISTVRLFFELLILITPVPLLDAVFECCNKTIAGILMIIYLRNPYLAFVLNIILFLFCLVIFRWVNRRLRYYKAVLLEPIWAGVVRKLFGREGWEPDGKMKRSLTGKIPDIELVIKVFPSRKLGKIKKKDRCYLVFAAGGLSLARPHWFKPPLIKPLETAGLGSEVKEGITSWWVEWTENNKPCELVFSSVYTNKRELIQSKLNALKSASKPQSENTVSGENE